MEELVDEMKHRARRLHRAAQTGDPSAVARLQRLPELASLEAAEVARRAQRRHALSVLARDLGFSGWPHAKAVLSGEEHPHRGEVMFRDSHGALCNVWSASYEEARDIRAAHGGYLLAYRSQFFIADASFIEHLGLDPDDPDWNRMGRDWVRPADRAAWARITHKALAARL